MFNWANALGTAILYSSHIWNGLLFCVLRQFYHSFWAVKIFNVFIHGASCISAFESENQFTLSKAHFVGAIRWLRQARHSDCRINNLHWAHSYLIIIKRRSTMCQRSHGTYVLLLTDNKMPLNNLSKILQWRYPNRTVQRECQPAASTEIGH